MTGTHLLRVVWPILDDRMFDDEAIYAAWCDWPAHPEQHQVTVVDTPRMQVVQLDPVRRHQLKAARAVVCEAAVIQRRSADRQVAA